MRRGFTIGTAVILILGFGFLDFLFFHDMLKPGETPTFAQGLTGILSVVVFAVVFLALWEDFVGKRR